MVRLRDASPDDAAAIGAIWNRIVRDTAISFWPTERSDAEVVAEITGRQSLGRAFMVAETDGAEIVGFASYNQFRGGGGYARSMEHTIHIAEGQRGGGIGRLLIAAVEDHARKAGHRLMIGAITGSNIGSIEFHARVGYAEWGRIPVAGWKFGQFHDLVLMGKDLWA